MSERFWKSLSCILALLLFLPSCSAPYQLAVPEEPAAPTSIEVPPAPVGDSKAGVNANVLLYYLSANAQRLVPTPRQLSVKDEETLAEAMLGALLKPPAQEGLQAVASPGTQLLSVEISQGVATANLSIEARFLSLEQLYILRQAIANTLCELPGVRYVNMLVGSREEGAETLPAGTFARTEGNVAAQWAQVEAESRMLSEQEEDARIMSRNTTLYFGSYSSFALPEVRSIRYSGTNYVQTILGELLKGPADTKVARRLLPDANYLTGTPRVVEQEDGTKIVEIAFHEDIREYLVRNGIAERLAYGSLVLTLCGFVPEVEGVRVRVGAGDLTALDDGQGGVMSFDGAILRRQDFEGIVGSLGVLYFPRADNRALVPVERAVAQHEAQTPRALLRGLMAGPRSTNAESGLLSVFPAGVSEADILGLRLEGGQALINLSGNFLTSCAGMPAQRERNVVYAIVNTLTEIPGVNKVQFYVEGTTVDAFAGAVYVRGPLLSNPGTVRTESDASER